MAPVAAAAPPPKRPPPPPPPTHVPTDQYLEWMLALLHQQKKSEEAVLRFLQECVIAPALDYASFCTRPFGSRAYGGALPCSDFDVAGSLVAGACGTTDLQVASSLNMSKGVLLKKMLELIRLHGDTTAVRDAILYKDTVQFRFAELRVDFTFNPWVPVDRHGPSALTGWLKESLSGLAEADSAKRFILLLQDCVRDTEACHSHAKGTIGNRLKPVHWTLLGVAYWKAAGTAGRQMCVQEIRREVCAIPPTPDKGISMNKSIFGELLEGRWGPSLVGGCWGTVLGLLGASWGVPWRLLAVSRVIAGL